MMLLHAALGICGEAGELADAIKRHVIYGKDLDLKNVIEELGDLRFYLQAVANLVKIPEHTILQENGNKLSERYKKLQYSDQAAIERADKKSGG
jgi:NTP pyrophosphatase (non-canonical NTP hydrolase)